MTLRPVSTRWFELIVLKQDFARAMSCVADSGVVQLEGRQGEAAAAREPAGAERAALAAAQARFEALSARYGGYWPEPVHDGFAAEADIAARFERALGFLDAWAAEAGSTVEALRAARAEIAELARMQDLFEAAGARVPHLGGFHAVGPHLKGLILLAPHDTEPGTLPEGVPVEICAGRAGSYLLAMGPAARLAGLESTAEAAGWERIELPGWLPAEAERALAEIGARLDRARAACRAEEAALAEIDRRHGLAEALGAVAEIRWLTDCARDVDQTPRLARITGWALETETDRLRAVLHGCGVHHVLEFPPAPAGVTPPVVLWNPAWARRFEALTRMIGLPASGEADPTMIVALVAPLLFGFMFGDVGQGLVLVAAGFWLRRRFPPLGILIPGGAMAIVFGFLFGSVFGREDVIPALWLHPLNEPILLLGVSIAGGAAILLTGLALRAVQMRWQGRWRDWALGDAGLVVAYLGLLAALVWSPWALAAAAAGALWFIAGTGLVAGAGAAARAIGELVETLLQLLVNTVSFARAGAFALAHAGLSVAIVGLADASGPLFYWPVLALGNAFVLALEGLVVSIQTTRLLLFEFFIRFLTGGGREFRPLHPPGGPGRFLKEAT